jgi:hypothetical protein
MERTPKLQLRKVVPLFTLPDKHGQPQNLARQRGREHLLLIIAQAGVDLKQYLSDLEPYTEEWRSLPARGIVVVPDEDAAGALGAQPFTVLIDANAQASASVRSRFLPDDVQIGVFVLDRYGDLYQQWLATSVAELPSAADLNGWLQAITMQCSI